jgi:hypothetical protein
VNFNTIQQKEARHLTVLLLFGRSASLIRLTLYAAVFNYYRAGATTFSKGKPDHSSGAAEPDGKTGDY